MEISRITLYQNKQGAFKVRISHGDRNVTGCWMQDARDAYKNAEMHLVVKPGYVSVSPNN